MDNSLEIYYLIVIVLFATFISLFIVISYKRKYAKKSKNFIFIIWWIIQAILIAFIISKIFTQLSIQNEKKILEKEAQNLAVTDYLKKIADQQKSALDEKERRENIISAVQKYFDVSKAKNINRYDSLFVFPVKKFFVITNVRKEKVNERIKFAWNHNPELSFTVTNENTHIDDYRDSVIVLVNLNIENKTKNVIAKIKYNKDLKIYSINNFYQTQNPTQKILSPIDTTIK